MAIALLPLVGCGDNVEPEPASTQPKQVVRVCEQLLPLPNSAVCGVTPGDDTRLIKGTVLTPGTTFVGGQVAFDAAGTITCVGCDCATGAETVLTCPEGVISPGLINTHDHITYALNHPVEDTGERYEHRHDWRTGLRGHTEIPVPQTSSADAVRFGELRFLFGGATSTNGSGGQVGILRNLDRANLLEGLAQPALHYQTFPLGDGSSSTQRRVSCNYSGTGDTAADIVDDESYTPHVAEGIDQVAHNEFLCESSDSYDTTMPGISNDLMLPQTAIIHGTGLLPSDFALMAKRKTKLIWSPRTNISLYGDTAQVIAADRLGVQIALGTDWIASGSTNMLRELQCADELNRNYYNSYFSDAALWRMVTVNAAAAAAVDDAIGVLTPGNVADISIFDGRTHHGLRAVIDAEPKNVTLVMRGGKPLYGDYDLIGALRTDCELVNVCGSDKQVCVSDEIGKTWKQLSTTLSSAYPAFYCAAPADEPTCTPSRPTSVNGSTVYTGDRTTTDRDGDGIANAADNCPDVFNPIRPLDNGKQADADGDGKGDVCDPCPLSSGNQCAAFAESDRDSDGKPDATDNCPLIYNADQADADKDRKGDACDDCPRDANQGDAPCPGTIYDVKDGTIPVDVQVVITNALVTGKGSNGFFLQVKESDSGYKGPDYSGIFVFTTNSDSLAAAEVGGRVTVEGQLSNFFGQLELSNVTSVTRFGTGVEGAPAPTVATVDEIRTGGTRASKLEAVIVQTGMATVTALNVATKEFTATQAALTLVVDDFLFANPYFPGVDQSYATLAGILAFRNNASKLEPRAQSDLIAIARIAGFAPGSAFIRDGQTAAATIPTPLEVRLTMPVTTDTFVAVTSSDTNALTVAGNGVTIPAGMLGAPVLLTALAPAAAVTLTATLGDQSFEASVRVLGAAEVPTTVTLSPDPIMVAPAGSTTAAVTLDLPAPAGGSVVTLSLDPADAGSFPATVTIPEDQTSAEFTYTDADMVTAATLTATFGASSDSSEIQVVAAPMGLIINEMDYDQVGSDNAEFIELYNGTNAAIDLTYLYVSLINGSNNTQYSRFALKDANGGTLPAGAYLVLAAANFPVAPGAILFTPAGWKATDNVQNGNPDGIAVISVPEVGTNSGVFIDRLSYEGPMTAVTIPDFADPVSLVEGTVLPTATGDSNSLLGSLARIPNGSDSNDAATDWAFTNQVTPGAANRPSM